MSETVDDLGSPPFASLPGKDVATDGPVQKHKLPISALRSPNLGAADAGLEVLQQLRVGVDPTLLSPGAIWLLNLISLEFGTFW